MALLGSHSLPLAEILKYPLPLLGVEPRPGVRLRADQRALRVARRLAQRGVLSERTGGDERRENHDYGNRAARSHSTSPPLPPVLGISDGPEFVVDSGGWGGPSPALPKNPIARSAEIG